MVRLLSFKFLILISFLGTMGLTTAQEITGVVTDETDQPLSSVSVVVKGTTVGTITDANGNFSIAATTGDTLVFSYIGFKEVSVEVKNQRSLEVTMKSGFDLDEVVLIGSRSPNRTVIESPVAVDVIDMTDASVQAGKAEINQILQYAAPSFNATKQTGSDGADHVDPASLRGLGPDQTLVLINGKRRHQSSLVNIFGTRGRGNTGTDLNAIPVASIRNIEILRDGASAQYGSDAIAGVINIVLKENVNELTGSVTYGAYNTNTDVNTSEFGEFGAWNTDGFRLDTDRDGNAIGEDKDLDGQTVKVSTNYGFEVGDGGFANFTTEYLNRNKTLRPGFAFRKGFGTASLEGFNFFGNLAVPVSDNTEIYAFGGRNYRDTDAFAFTRNDGARVVRSIYPNGFTPRITSTITDNSVAAGVRTETNSGWKVDISNTYGKNNFHYYIKGTLNASLEEVSPTDFDAGGHSLSQNTINFDFSKYYENYLSGFNLALGGEYRTENFEIFAGEEASYGTYTEDGLLITDPDTQNQAEDDDGNPRPGGSQGFPGYGPDNVVDRSRSNFSLYADAELNFTDDFLVAVAGRFENYSDFGSTINGKLATRYKLADGFNLRGSVSTGFRAPSLTQIYYNLKFTNFVGGQALETVLSPNNSPVTASFGIGPLKEEEATNAAFGVTSKFDKFTATVDGYYIKVKDRIVLTGNFSAPQIPNVQDAQFFANGADTETFGLDVILSYKNNLSDDSFVKADFLANFNDMSITKVNNNGLDEQTFFGERDKAFLLASAPDSKINLNLSYDKSWFDSTLSFTRFSEIELLDFRVFDDPADYGGLEQQLEAATDYYGAKYVVDLNFGFDLSGKLKLNVGGNNLFNVYPDQQDDFTEAGGYFDSVQMGINGAYYYTKLDFNF